MTEATAQFALQRIYVKDLSFEAPGAPKVFVGDWKPDVKIDLATHTARIEGDGNLYEVTLELTVTAKNQDQVAFLVELKQSGIFLLENIPEDQVGQLLGAYCPNILFPYARETISDVVTRGSFPQMLLSPVNFDAVYAESVRQQASTSEKLQ